MESLLCGWSDELPTIVAFICHGEHRPITGAIPIGVNVIEVRKIKVLFDPPDFFQPVTILGKKPSRDPSAFLFELRCDQFDILGFAPTFEPKLY